MDKVWGKWQFSPQLESQLQQFAALWLVDGAQPYQMQLKATDSEDKVLEPTVCNTECTEELQDDCITPGPNECASLIEQDSVVLPSSSLVDVLEERVAVLELSAVSVEQLLPVLPDLSDTAALHLCQTVCACGPQQQSQFSNLLFTHLLLPRLRDSGASCSRHMLAALQQAVDSFPHQASAELLLPLMLVQSANHSVIETLISQLSVQNKLVVLRLFVESCSSLVSEWQVPALQNLIVSTADGRLNQQLVSLLTNSLKGFPTSVKFGKLLVTVIQQLGPNLTTVMKEQLAVAVSQHKSLMRKVAEKALRALDS